jgi:hypothetical protein
MRTTFTLLTAICLCGCISTQEMPVAPNIVRLDTQAQGLLFTGQAVPATMRAAAKATLSRGYTHFRIADVNSQQGSTVIGAISTANSSASYGGTYNGNWSGGSFSGGGSSTGLGTTNVIRAPTAATGATVIMFHASEPGAQGAFEAEQVLKQYQ